MAFLLDHLGGGIASQDRERPRVDATTILRRLAWGRRGRLAFRAGLMALAGAGLLWGGLEGATVILASRAAASGVIAAIATPQSWAEVIRPIALYDLSGTEFAKLPRTYRARRHAPDGAREDILTFGKLGDDKPYLRIDLRREDEAAPEDDAAAPLAEALAHAAGASGGTVTRLRPLPSIETRFGTVERADLLLWEDGIGTDCRGFRGLPNGGRVLAVAGFACGAGGRPLAQAAVACAVDRLDLLAAGDDHPLRALFVAAERRPGAAACGGGLLEASAAPPVAPGPYDALRRRAEWLEAGSAGPPLRGALDATADER